MLGSIADPRYVNRMMEIIAKAPPPSPITVYIPRAMSFSKTLFSGLFMLPCVPVSMYLSHAVSERELTGKGRDAFITAKQALDIVYVLMINLI